MAGVEGAEEYSMTPGSWREGVDALRREMYDHIENLGFTEEVRIIKTELSTMTKSFDALVKDMQEGQDIVMTFNDEIDRMSSEMKRVHLRVDEVASEAALENAGYRDTAHGAMTELRAHMETSIDKLEELLVSTMSNENNILKEQFDNVQKMNT